LPVNQSVFGGRKGDRCSEKKKRRFGPGEKNGKAALMVEEKGGCLLAQKKKKAPGLQKLARCPGDFAS